MSKESVALPTTIDHAGIMTIRHLVGSHCGIYLTEELMGGFYRVSNDGKIAKRIRRNLKRELGIVLSNDLISMVGNAANSYSFKDENYLTEYIEDLESIIGEFADDDSCFRPGHQNHHHLLALMDIGVLAFCIYRSNGQNLGRAWCYRVGDNTEVFFNAYGFDLVKIARIASVLHGKATIKAGRIEASHDIWLNQGGDAYILNGGDQTRFLMNIKSPETFAPYHCENCNRPIWSLEDTQSAPNDTTWCYSCYRDHFWRCERCNETKDNQIDKPQYIHGSRSYSVLCIGCVETRSYSQCDHCTGQIDDGEPDPSANPHWYLNMRGLQRYTTADGVDLLLCDGHYNDHTRCRFCGNDLTPGQTIEVLGGHNQIYRSCLSCVNNDSQINYCVDCNALSHRRRARYARSESRPMCYECDRRVEFNPVLIVQEFTQTIERHGTAAESETTITGDTSTTVTFTDTGDAHTATIGPRLRLFLSGNLQGEQPMIDMSPDNFIDFSHDNNEDN